MNNKAERGQQLARFNNYDTPKGRGNSSLFLRTFDEFLSHRGKKANRAKQTTSVAIGARMMTSTNAAPGG